MSMNQNTRLLQASMSTSNLPSLPGTQSRRVYKASYHKPQRFKICNDGNRIELDCKPSLDESLRASPMKSLSELYDRKQKLLGEWEGLQLQEKFQVQEAANQKKTITSSKSQPLLRVPPSWVKHDRQVLSFRMYFKEAVHESSRENFRVRKCVLFYYLADNTVRIEEPKEVNSGLPQGVFLKKQPLEKDDGSLYQPADFLIGMENTIFGRTFRVVDCDNKTREYFEEQGIEIGEPEGYPEDPHRRRLREQEENSGNRVESIAGGKPPDTLGKYLKNDRKVLRFNCFWDDTKRLYGEKNDYVLHYFLSDDTIEIRNRSKKGSDPFPLLLKRQKLLRNMHEPEEGTYVVEDLRCGEFIDCYSRRLLLVSCDDYTKKYYERVHGIDQPVVKISETSKPLPINPVPPYNGFGSEADSLANCLNLVPKPVKMDLQRFLSNRGKELKFKAKIVDSGPEDCDRSFVITYYMDDDTCAIYEPPKRNSGIVGGKFLERGKYKLPIREKKAKAAKHRLEDHVLEKIESRMVGGPYGLIRAFRQFGTEKDGSIGMVGFRAGLRYIGVLPETASDEDIDELYRNYDTSGDGKIDFQEFVEKVMQDKNSAHNEGSFSTRWLRSSDFYVGAILRFVFPQTGAHTQEFEITSATAATLDLMEQHKDEFPMSNVDVIFSHLATTLSEYGIRVREIFKNIDLDGKGYISTEQFLTLLAKWAKDFGFVDEDLSEQEKLTILRRYDEDGDGKIAYNEFCDAVTKGKGKSKKKAETNMGTLAEILDRLQSNIENERDLKEKFQQYDQNMSGILSISEFEEMILENVASDLSKEELHTLMLFFDRNGNGVVDFNEFKETLFFKDDQGNFSAKLAEEVSLNKTQESRKQNMIEYQEIVRQAEENEDSQNDLLLLMKSFTATFKNKSKSLRKSLLSFDLDRVGTIRRAEFVEALYRTNPDYSNRDRATLLAYIFPTEKAKLDYDLFIDIMFSQDTRKAMNEYGRLV